VSTLGGSRTAQQRPHGGFNGPRPLLGVLRPCLLRPCGVPPSRPRSAPRNATQRRRPRRSTRRELLLALIRLVRAYAGHQGAASPASQIRLCVDRPQAAGRLESEWCKFSFAHRGVRAGRLRPGTRHGRGSAATGRLLLCARARARSAACSGRALSATPPPASSPTPTQTCCMDREHPACARGPRSADRPAPPPPRTHY
jgi:hypothetical protein